MGSQCSVSCLIVQPLGAWDMSCPSQAQAPLLLSAHPGVEGDCGAVVAVATSLSSFQRALERPGQAGKGSPGL